MYWVKNTKTEDDDVQSQYVVPLYQKEKHRWPYSWLMALSMTQQTLMQSHWGLITCFPVMTNVPLVIVASGPNICVWSGIPGVVVHSSFSFAIVQNIYLDDDYLQRWPTSTDSILALNPEHLPWCLMLDTLWWSIMESTLYSQVLWFLTFLFCLRKLSSYFHLTPYRG